MNELYSQEIELNKLVCKLKYGRYCVVQDKYFLKIAKKKVSMKNEDTSMIIFFFNSILSTFHPRVVKTTRSFLQMEKMYILSQP